MTFTFWLPYVCLFIQYCGMLERNGNDANLIPWRCSRYIPNNSTYGHEWQFGQVRENSSDWLTASNAGRKTKSCLWKDVSGWIKLTSSQYASIIRMKHFVPHTEIKNYHSTFCKCFKSFRKCSIFNTTHKTCQRSPKPVFTFNIHSVDVNFSCANNAILAAKKNQTS